MKLPEYWKGGGLIREMFTVDEPNTTEIVQNYYPVTLTVIFMNAKHLTALDEYAVCGWKIKPKNKTP